MIDIDKSIQTFNKYLDNYDMNNFKQKLKKNHTLRVMDKCEEIAVSLGLSKEDIDLSKLIGLLHDIGRFEQVKRYDVFEDHKSINHALLGIEILEKDNYINEYIKDEELQKIVITAIKNHNRLYMEDNLDERTLFFCKLIRDADKLDILYLYEINELEIKQNMGIISEACYLDFISYEAVKIDDIETDIDSVLTKLSYLFDFNFEYCYKYLKETNLLNNIIDRLIETNPNETEKLNKIKEIVNIYLEK